jgi:hypothetical protein
VLLEPVTCNGRFLQLLRWQAGGGQLQQRDGSLAADAHGFCHSQL